ncbi:MAG: hypothetical protein ACK53L_32575 [Pirellulaceae bacterium]
MWQQHRAALTHLDLSDDPERQIVIARGSPKPDEYHAHPTTAMLAVNKTIFCVWNIGHGGHAGPMARSDDVGLSWTRVDDAFPPNYVNFKNCPSIYRLTDPQGKQSPRQKPDTPRTSIAPPVSPMAVPSRALSFPA